MALRAENQREDSFLLRRYIEKAMADLPAIPNIAMQVVQATDRENVTTAELEDLVSKDAAIATKLLKVVNSAYFGLPRQITNISHAVAILGLQQVRNLVMSLGVLNTLTSKNPRIAEIQKIYWRQSFAAATGAEWLASRAKLTKNEIDAIFVGGLLHDVGRLFLLTMFNLPYMEVLKDSIRKQMPIWKSEYRILGTTHSELGAALAEKWNFPPDLVRVIRNHNGPFDEADPTPEFCVHIAGALASQVMGDAIGGVPEAVMPEAAEWANLTDSEAESLKLLMMDTVESAKEMLGIL